MKIIIVGCGKVGYTIAKDLSAEKGVNITIIDTDPNALSKAFGTIDVMFIKGNGLNADTLIEAGVKEADLLISVTNTDEANILCCILAKHIGIKHTAARIRNPEYAMDVNKYWKKLRPDMIINPEYETAREISRLLRFPSVDDIDTFVNGRVELVSFNVSEAGKYFVGKTVSQVFNTKKMNILLAMIERGNTAIIPNGSIVFEKHDTIRILGRPSNIMEFFALIGKNTNKVKNTVIIGGSKITHYLVELLHRHSGGTDIKIIEIDKERCEELSELFPRCLIIHGDGTDEKVASLEIADRTEAVVCLTDRDEENTIIALYSHQNGARKVILKINYINKNMVKGLGLGSIVSPPNIISDQILRYVRGLRDASSDSIKTMYRIFDSDGDKAEAIEFTVNKHTRCLDIPIKDMKLKKGILIGCIVRNSNIIIPSGDDVIYIGDSIIIIAKKDDIYELDDIILN